MWHSRQQAKKGEQTLSPKTIDKTQDPFTSRHSTPIKIYAWSKHFKLQEERYIKGRKHVLILEL